MIPVWGSSQVMGLSLINDVNMNHGDTNKSGLCGTGSDRSETEHASVIRLWAF